MRPMIAGLWPLLTLTAALSCSSGSGGNGGDAGPGGSAIVVPEVPAGAHETACMALCTLGVGEKICTPKHAEFCLARCRASTRDLPAACADCVLADGTATPISGYTIGSDSYCTVGGAAKLSKCPKECDDGAGQPAPALETLCQLYCGFYVQEAKPLACSAMSSADCLAACHTTIASKGRACAQCLIEQTRPGRSCINDACECLNSFDDDPAISCTTLCDGQPPA